MSTVKNHSVEIYERIYTLAIGSLVRPESWHVSRGVRLLDGEDFSDFRLPLNSGGPIESLACDIEITGRTLQRINGDLAVKVRITVPTDCDYVEGGSMGGWFFVDR